MLHLNNKKMALRTIHERIKDEKWTVSNFAEYFGVTSEVFLNMLKKRTGTQYKTYSDGLEKNEKLVKVSNSAPSTKIIPDVAPPSKQEKPVVCSVEKTEPELQNGNTVDRETMLLSEINQLRTHIESISKECDDTDAYIKSKRADMLAIQEEVSSYLEKVKVAREKYTALEREVGALERSYEKAWEDFAAKGEELAKKEAELEAYKTVEVYFDQNGLHVSKDEYVPTKDDIGAKHLELSEMEAYEYCAVRDVKAVAAICAAVSLLKASGIKYVIAYDKCPEVVSTMLSKVAA